MRSLERGDRFVFGHLVRAGFDHDDAVPGAGDDEIELALLALRESRVDDELAVDEADAHRGDGFFNRHLRQRERRAGAGEREHV